MIYISIESRKGGVGKTTIALSLAQTLIEKGYQVLMLDLDIVGTKMNSSFIRENHDLIHEVSYQGDSVNLLHLFKEVFMIGNNIPAFSDNKNIRNRLTFEYGKCNFIGSDIYDDNSKEKKKDDDSKNKKKDNNLIEDPRVLYDAFHAYWMLEFVKVIANEFNRVVGNNEKVAILLDNSPGFSSIENGIHDFLTDLGPNKGKVLLVSSIDPQDIEACRESKESIQTLLKDKIAASNYYHSLVNNEKEKKVDKKESEAFDSVWNSLCASGGTLPEYYSADVPKEDLTFVRILFNKVPRIIYKDLFKKELLNENNDYAVPFLNHLLYYFNNSVLKEKQIEHNISFTDRINEYKLSGELANSIKDEKRFQRFCEFTKKIGYGVFFTREWSPLAPFEKIIDSLKKQEVIKDEPITVFDISNIKLAKGKTKIEVEVDLAKRMVLSIIKKSKNKPKNKEYKELPIDDVATFVTKAIEESEGIDSLEIQSDSIKFRGIEEFVTVFGLAAYRFHIYDVFCDLINELMVVCLDDAEKMETLDRDNISDTIADFLEGKIKGEKMREKVTQMLSSKKNARELSSKLKEVIESWGL